MSWKLFVAHRIYRSNEGGKEVSKPAVRIAMWGIAVGLAVMILAVAVVVGFKHEVRDKVVLDMGCGTAVLAILAAKMKAAKVYGIDIDAVAAISAYDNARLNKVGTRIETCCGDASLLQRNTYDVILANINRNILLQDIPTYSLCLHKEGLLFVSGFYVEDMPMIIGMAQNSGLTYVSHDSIDNWCCIKFQKN